LTYGDSGRNIVVEHMHRFIGRPGVPDKVRGDCNLTNIDTRGGKDDNRMDEVTFDDHQACNKNQNEPVNIHVGPYTRVKNTRSSGRFLYYITKDVKTKTIVDIEIVPPKNDTDSLHRITIDCQSTQITLDSREEIDKSSTQYTFSFEEGHQNADSKLKLILAKKIWQQVELPFADSVVANIEQNGKLLLYDCGTNDHNTIDDFTRSELKSIGRKLDNGKKKVVAFEPSDWENKTTIVLFENVPDKISEVFVRASHFVLNIMLKSDGSSVEACLKSTAFNDVFINRQNSDTQIFINARNFLPKNDNSSDNKHVFLASKSSTGLLLVSLFCYKNQELLGRIIIETMNQNNEMRTPHPLENFFILSPRHNVSELGQFKKKSNTTYIRPLSITVGFDPEGIPFPPLHGVIRGQNSPDWLAFKIFKTPDSNDQWKLTEDTNGSMSISLGNTAKNGTSWTRFMIVYRETKKADYGRREQPVKMTIEMDQDDATVLILRR